MHKSIVLTPTDVDNSSYPVYWDTNESSIYVNALKGLSCGDYTCTHRLVVPENTVFISDPFAHNAIIEDGNSVRLGEYRLLYILKVNTGEIRMVFESEEENCIEFSLTIVE